MNNNIESKIKNSPLSIDQIAEVAGYSRDYIFRLKRDDGQRRLNEDVLENLARALKCYPSELLPDDWQKPSDQISIDKVVELFQKELEAQQKEIDPLKLVQHLIIAVGDEETPPKVKDSVELLNVFFSMCFDLPVGNVLNNALRKYNIEMIEKSEKAAPKKKDESKA